MTVSGDTSQSTEIILIGCAVKSSPNTAGWVGTAQKIVGVSLARSLPGTPSCEY